MWQGKRRARIGLEATAPPERLYHGTADRLIESIKKHGLRRGRRHHVHLSQDTETAVKVSKRHGKPVVLTIGADAMQNDGFVFYRSDNGTWLTECVPVQYIEFPK